MEYSIGVIFFAIVTVLLSIFIFKRRRQTKQEAAVRRVAGLAADLQAGGAGRAGGGGRVEGEVAVYVLSSQSGGCVGVCVCPVLQVIYWWRLSLTNGQVLSVPGEAVAGEKVTQARAGAAAIRLWGEMWAGADRVTLHLQHIRSETHIYNFLVDLICNTLVTPLPARGSRSRRRTVRTSSVSA